MTPLTKKTVYYIGTFKEELVTRRLIESGGINDIRFLLPPMYLRCYRQNDLQKIGNLFVLIHVPINFLSYFIVNHTHDPHRVCDTRCPYLITTSTSPVPLPVPPPVEMRMTYPTPPKTTHVSSF